jgi:hypothetical protein
MKNYLALKMPGHAGDLFNDAISKLPRIQRKYQEKQERQQHHCYYYDDNKISLNFILSCTALSTSLLIVMIF